MLLGYALLFTCFFSLMATLQMCKMSGVCAKTWIRGIISAFCAMKQNISMLRSTRFPGNPGSIIAIICFNFLEAKLLFHMVVSVPTTKVSNLEYFYKGVRILYIVLLNETIKGLVNILLTPNFKIAIA